MNTAALKAPLQQPAARTGGKEPPRLKGGLPLLGHMISFARNPYGFMKRAHDEGGEVIAFRMLSQNIVLLTGAMASHAFYRAPDEQLDQSAAYKLMTPIFGEGIVFDAPIHRKDEQLKMLMPSLQMGAMKQHSGKVVQEVEDLIKDWGDSGEIELVEFMKQLTINTASHCLLGREFRYEMSSEFAKIYHDLEKGVNPLAYHYPYLPIPAFRKRDRARKRLLELVGGIVQKRKQQTEKPSDMFQTLIDATYKDGTKLTDNEITGMLLGAIFAGHHTSSGTAAWVLLEMLKQPQILRDVRKEIEDLLGSDGAVTFQSLREVPKLENVLKEVLRLHPPLIVLMRQVEQDLPVGEYVIKKGDMVWASPPVTQRIAKLFPNPDVFDPERYSGGREEDKNLDAYQPFGGGKHKCSGNAFAMFQIKAIFCILLRRYEFELVDAPETYVDDYTQMIVQPKAPCRVRYKRRVHATEISAQHSATSAAASSDEGSCPFHTQLKPAPFAIAVDRQLCQGHSMCVGEAPELFELDAAGLAQVKTENISASLLKKAQKAEQFCPNKAIKVTVAS
jgi:sterol 14-demethylase